MPKNEKDPENDANNGANISEKKQVPVPMTEVAKDRPKKKEKQKIEMEEYI